MLLLAIYDLSVVYCEGIYSGYKTWFYIGALLSNGVQIYPAFNYSSSFVWVVYMGSHKDN